MREPMESEGERAARQETAEARIAEALARCERAADRLAAAAGRHRHLDAEARAVLADLDRILAASREHALG